MPLIPSKKGCDQSMRIFFECSNTATNHIKTGIQRVVRNVVLHLDAASRDLMVEAKPAKIHLDRFYLFNWQPTPDPCESSYLKYIRKHRLNPFLNSFNEPRSAKMNKFGIRLKKTVRFRKFRKFIHSLYCKFFKEPLSPRPGDLMVMLDASWGIHIDSAVDGWRKQGGKVAFVIYDILPITHPHFFSKGLVERFSNWYDFVINNADLLLAISDTVRDQLRERLNLVRDETAALPPKVESFRLGAHLDMQHADGYIRPRLRAALSEISGSTPYLMVGTVEPRKNHRTVIEAFDQLWKQGELVRLFIVGKVGWECRDLEQTLREHPELHRKLFWFPDLSDTELHQCYKSSRCVIFASWGEGFGLPIVEGLLFGRPVIASDLPVHREVARDFAAYFNPSHSDELVAMIRQLETHGSFPGVTPPDEFRAPSWEEGVADLLNHCRNAFSQTTGTP